MMGAIRFRAYPDAPPALDRAARARARAGLRLELGLRAWRGARAAAGWRRLLDGVVTSAAVGARKPDPAIFAAALELAGCDPAEALHVGDTPAEDVAGARAAGIEARADRPRRRTAIASLAEIERSLRP